MTGRANASNAAPAPEGLGSYRRALHLEAHGLAEQPGLTVQPLQNRLQWEVEAIEECLAPQRERRSGSGLGLRINSSVLKTLTSLRATGEIRRG